VQFSDDTDPHPAENTQQTPNPEAQLPPFVPPLFEHSSLLLENIHEMNRLV